MPSTTAIHYLFQYKQNLPSKEWGILLPDLTQKANALEAEEKNIDARKKMTPEDRLQLTKLKHEHIGILLVLTSIQQTFSKFENAFFTLIKACHLNDDLIIGGSELQYPEGEIDYDLPFLLEHMVRLDIKRNNLDLALAHCNYAIRLLESKSSHPDYGLLFRLKSTYEDIRPKTIPWHHHVPAGP